MQAHSSNNEMQEWRPESSESRNTVLNRFWGSGGFRSDLRKGSAFLAIVVRKMKNQGEKRPLPLSERRKAFPEVRAAEPPRFRSCGTQTVNRHRRSNMAPAEPARAYRADARVTSTDALRPPPSSLATSPGERCAPARCRQRVATDPESSPVTRARLPDFPGD